jgi:phosphomannomutase
MSAFKAYDIRGKYPSDFNRDDAYKIGYFLPRLLHTKKVLVGRDVRLSSDEIFENLARGITDAGADVHDAGLATTPMVYWGTAFHKFDASVQITASHNPAEYNGMKVSMHDALPVGYDNGLNKIERWMKTEPVVVSEVRGKIIQTDIKTDYLSFLSNYIPDLSGMKIAVDCSNGMAALFVKDLLGKEPIYIYDDLDGSFPNHEPNPLEQENLHGLISTVLSEKCDIGVIYDGDADRVMFVDEKGHFISPDLMIGVLAHYYAGKETGNVLQDIRTSKAVGEYVIKLGFKMHTWRVGRAYAAPKLREINGIFGGELAGHYYMRDFYYSDSGLLASMLLLTVLGDFIREGKTVSQVINGISAYANSGEINFKIQDKSGAMNALKDFFSAAEKPTADFDFDGYRLEFPEWWFNVRPSNTEPYLRFLAEASSDDLLASKLKEVRRIVAPYLDQV